MKKILSFAVMMMAMVAVLTSCQKEKNGPEATSLKITQTLTVTVGQTATIEATVTPSNAGITWSSKNTAIATVDNKGVVTGVAAGETFITAVSGSQADMCKVTVKADMSGVSFNITVSDITGTTATVAIAPSDKEMTYYWDIVDLDTYNNITTGAYADYDINNVADYLAYMLNYYYQNYSSQGYTYADFLSQGDDGYTYEGLSPETNYVVICAPASDEDGAVSEPVVTETFATAQVQASANQITMTYANGAININTTNNDEYIFIFETKAEYDTYQTSMDAAAIENEAQLWINTMAQYQMTSYFTYNGNQTINVNEFWSTYLSEEAMAAGEYIAFAAPYAGAINGTVAYCLFTYEGATGAPARKSADFNLVKKQAPAFKTYKTVK